MTTPDQQTITPTVPPITPENEQAQRTAPFIACYATDDSFELCSAIALPLTTELQQRLSAAQELMQRPDVHSVIDEALLELEGALTIKSMWGVQPENKLIFTDESGPENIHTRVGQNPDRHFYVYGEYEGTTITFKGPSIDDILAYPL